MNFPASQPQVDYLEALFGDLCFNRATRNGWLTRECGRTINAPDELSKSEASRCITLLREQKERTRNAERSEDESD